jgi:hypothetical protein
MHWDLHVFRQILEERDQLGCSRVMYEGSEDVGASDLFDAVLSLVFRGCGGEGHGSQRDTMGEGQLGTGAVDK